jgi:hypothetical protein
VGGEGGGEHVGPGGLDGLGTAVVDIGGGVQAQGRMAMLGLYQGKKTWQCARAASIEAKRAGKSGAATPAMLVEARGRPDDASIRRALVRWGFNTKQRPDPPDDAAEVLDWVARNTVPVSTLTEPATARRMLDLATGTVDGRNAAASTARRHRIILANAMDYAVELGLLETNPIRVLKWTAPKVSSQVDRRSVVNPRQARALLDAVRAQQPSGPRLVAFFAVMYYAGLRPEEAINLSADNVILPPRAWDAERQLWQDPPEDGDWGELHLRTATPDAGSEWTDDGSSRERRQLKHRAEGDSRIVPTHPN